ncbi:MAG: hypothetical protein OEM89_10590 [Nitrosopumilus sp.]|nr:hypothetical protein [Nitrosopumilus sp.]
MEHSFFFDGDSKRIRWVIQNNKSTIDQKREHPEIYINNVTIQESKYIAMHVGLFWGIGKFIIKNGDRITIKVDDKTIFAHLSKNEESPNDFIKTRMCFITQLIKQRKLKINYELVNKENDLDSKL